MKPSKPSFVHGTIVGALVIAGIFLLAGIVSSVPSTTTAYHALQDVAKSATNLTSVDADADGVIDAAQQACGAGINCDIDSADITDGTITAADILATQVQKRIVGGCTGANAVQVINSDGTVTCVAISGGAPPEYVVQSVPQTFTNVNTGSVTNICPGSNPHILGCSQRLNVTGAGATILKQWAQPSLSSTCSVGVQFGTSTTFTLTAYSICSS